MSDVAIKLVNNDTIIAVTPGLFSKYDPASLEYGDEPVIMIEARAKAVCLALATDHALMLTDCHVPNVERTKKKQTTRMGTFPGQIVHARHHTIASPTTIYDTGCP